jgi:hypothetical protein
VPKTDSLAKSASYPSGHSTLSWAWGLILAEIVPDRATEILMRAREIGDSRIICGVHYLSDVEEGRTNGSILVAALHASPEFKADLEKARAEIIAARAAPHASPAGCAAIEAAEAHPPYCGARLFSIVMTRLVRATHDRRAMEVFHRLPAHGRRPALAITGPPHFAASPLQRGMRGWGGRYRFAR